MPELGAGRSFAGTVYPNQADDLGFVFERFTWSETTFGPFQDSSEDRSRQHDGVLTAEFLVLTVSFANAIENFLSRLYAEIASIKGFLKLKKRVFV